MSTLSRSSFVSTLKRSSIKLADLDGLSSSQQAALKKADVNGDGRIKGSAELDRMFTQLDTFDKNGKLSSVNTSSAPIAKMTEAIATAAGKPKTALKGTTSGSSDTSGSAGSTTGTGGVTASSSQTAKLAYAKKRAKELGLTITSTTGGTHTPGSYHYKGRAVDVAGSPAVMKQYYREMATLSPTELFHDPVGGMKNGRNIGAIGGHGRHVHVAF